MKGGNDEQSNSPGRIHSVDQKIDNDGAEYRIEDQMKYTSPESEVSTPIKDIQVDVIDRKVQQKETHAASTSEEENDDKEPFYYKSIRPPYTKARISITKTTPDLSPTDTGAKVLEKTQKTDHNGDSDGLQPDGSIGDTKPKPKSVRRRIQKTLAGQDKVENSKPVGSENVSSKGSNGEEEGRQNLKISDEGKHDERDEEEKIMDRLLLHYSRKKLPPDTGESEDDLHPSPQKYANNRGGGTKDTGRNGLQSRTAPLPTESSPTKATRLHAQASSFQPEVLNSNGHVHPKMPEYDDFLARLAALQGATKK